MLNKIVDAVNYVLWNYLAIILLIGAGIVFTLCTKFVQVRMLKDMFRIIFSKPEKKTEGREISGFQAFCISAASHVGAGNIAGVAISIVTGGPGAVFWMWVTAFLGCSVSFAESTLAQIYKLPKEGGQFYGGPAYYIQNALRKPGLAKFFAVLISITFGLIYVSVQSNTIAQSVKTAFGINTAVTGIFAAVLTGVIICGGITRIAKFTEKFVPVMAGIYLLSSLFIIIMNIESVPSMFALIIHDAFSPQAAIGGGLGAVFMTGVKRGLYSNEAGEGSIPNAAASAACPHPVRQGLIHSFGVYVDTWLICSATAFIVLLSGQYVIGGELTGVSLVQQSLAGIYGSYAPHAIALIIFLFAFSTIIGNYYYGEVNIAFFEGCRPGVSKSAVMRKAMNIFRAGVIIMVFWGSIAELKLIWNCADLFMGLLCITNISAVLLLGKYVFIALEDYVSQKKRGIIEPVFDKNIMPDKTGIYAWD